MEKLIVRNFGPIQDVEIELKDLTIFIGETGTGKSTLAKLIAIFRDTGFWVNFSEDNFFDKLSYYQINGPAIFNSETHIKYELSNGSESIFFEYESGVITQNFSDKVLHLLETIKEQLYEIDKIDSELDKKKITSLISAYASQNFYESIFIPADRGIVSTSDENYAALDKDKLLDILSKPLREFSGLFNGAANKLQELRVDIFAATYKRDGNKHRIVLENGNNTTLSLPEAASGMQTLIPVLVILEHFANSDTRKSYIFEEPELNLFPLTQKKLVEFLAAKALGNGHKLVITTHSPYILIALNNLLFAYQITNSYPGSEDDVITICDTTYFVSPSNVVIYYLSADADSDSVNLIDTESGMIMDENLDSASDEIMTVFDNLMELRRGLKKSIV